MAEAGIGVIPLRPDWSEFSGAKFTKGFDPAINGADKHLHTRFGSIFKSVAGLGAGLLAGVAIKNFMGDAISEAREGQRIGKITAQLIETTGGAANLTADQISHLATRMSNLAGVDDELVQEGANVLLTFKNVRDEVGKGNDVFSRATAAGLDMSTVLGTDLKSANVLLGKALNDPLKGITALTRAGVTFTEKQKEQIKTLVESGDVLGAQKVILGELEGQMGGAAAAAADPFQKFGVAVGNLKESIGEVLLPLLGRMADFLSRNIGPAFEKVTGTTRGFVAAFREGFEFGVTDQGGIVGFIAKVGDITFRLYDWAKANLPLLFDDLRAWWAMHGPTVIGALERMRDVAVAAFDGLVRAIQWVIRNWDGLKTPLMAVAGIITGLLIPHWIALGVNATIAAAKSAAAWVVQSTAGVVHGAKIIASIVAQVAHWVLLGAQSLLHAAKVAAAWFIAAGPIAWVIAAVAGLVVAIIKNWDTIKAVISAGWDFVKRNAETFIRVFLAVLTGGFSELVLMIARNWDKITAGADAAFDAVVSFITDLPGRVVGALGDLGTLLFNKGKELIRGFQEGIEAAAGGVVGFVKDLPGRAADALNPFNDGEGAGRAVGGRSRASMTGSGAGALLDVGRRMGGMSASSVYRPGAITRSGNQSYHALGRAVDWVGPNLRAVQMRWQEFGPILKELIGPNPGMNWKNGRPYRYSAAIQADHGDHVHTAFDSGGYLPPGIHTVGNFTGKPEPILTSDQWKTLSSAAAAGGAPSAMTVTVKPEWLREFVTVEVARADRDAADRMTMLGV